MELAKNTNENSGSSNITAFSHVPVLHNTIYRNANTDRFSKKEQVVPIVIIHGFPVDHRMWDDCAQELNKLIDNAVKSGTLNYDTPIFAPDMPGAGLSEIPSSEQTGAIAQDGAYTEALDKVAAAYVKLILDSGYKRAFWVGLSMGGYVALAIQKLFPDSVAAIALCDTKSTADNAEHRADRIRIAHICEQLHTFDPVMHFAKAKETDSSIKKTADFCKRFENWITQQSTAGIAWRERMAAGREDLTDQLAKITAPVAIVSGNLDPSSSPTVMKPYVKEISASSNVSFTEIDDCGHFSATEHPDEVAKALFDVLAQVRR